LWTTANRCRVGGQPVGSQHAQILRVTSLGHRRRLVRRRPQAGDQVARLAPAQERHLMPVAEADEEVRGERQVAPFHRPVRRARTEEW